MIVREPAPLALLSGAARLLWRECVRLATATEDGTVRISGRHPGLGAISIGAGLSRQQAADGKEELIAATLLVEEEGILRVPSVTAALDRSRAARARARARWGAPYRPRRRPALGPIRVQMPESPEVHAAQPAAVQVSIEPANDNREGIAEAIPHPAPEAAPAPFPEPSWTAPPSPPPCDTEWCDPALEGEILSPDGPTPPPPGARAVLWTHGLPLLRRLTGISDQRARGILGKLLRVLRDDCAACMGLLLEAEDLHPIDPIPWLFGAAGSRRDRRGWMRDAAAAGEIGTLDDLEAAIAACKASGAVQADGKMAYDALRGSPLDLDAAVAAYAAAHKGVS